MAHSQLASTAAGDRSRALDGGDRRPHGRISGPAAGQESAQHRTRRDIYIQSRHHAWAGVRRWMAVKVHIYAYVHVVVHARGDGIYRREDAVPPPAAGPRATPLGVPLPHRGAPFGGDSGPQGPLPEYAPGRAYWSTANWPTPRLPPCLGLLPPR